MSSIIQSLDYSLNKESESDNRFEALYLASQLQHPDMQIYFNKIIAELSDNELPPIIEDLKRKLSPNFVTRIRERIASVFTNENLTHLIAKIPGVSLQTHNTALVTHMGNLPGILKEIQSQDIAVSFDPEQKGFVLNDQLTLKLDDDKFWQYNTQLFDFYYYRGLQHFGNTHALINCWKQDIIPRLKNLQENKCLAGSELMLNLQILQFMNPIAFEVLLEAIENDTNVFADSFFTKALRRSHTVLDSEYEILFGGATEPGAQEIIYRTNKSAAQFGKFVSYSDDDFNSFLQTFNFCNSVIKTPYVQYPDLVIPELSSFIYNNSPYALNAQEALATFRPAILGCVPQILAICQSAYEAGYCFINFKLEDFIFEPDKRSLKLTQWNFMETNNYELPGEHISKNPALDYTKEISFPIYDSTGFLVVYPEIKTKKFHKKFMDNLHPSLEKLSELICINQHTYSMICLIEDIIEPLCLDFEDRLKGLKELTKNPLNLCHAEIFWHDLNKYLVPSLIRQTQRIYGITGHVQAPKHLW